MIRLTRAQERIIEDLGEDAVEEAENRLCKKCARFEHCVYLLALTSDGEDCPYFVKRSDDD